MLNLLPNGQIQCTLCDLGVPRRPARPSLVEQLRALGCRVQAPATHDGDLVIECPEEAIERVRELLAGGRTNSG